MELLGRRERTKAFYSLFDYTCVSLVYFRSVEASEHYLEHHLQDMPWAEVIEKILATKRPRKKGTKYEIEDATCYILFEVRDGTLQVINAKRR